MSGSGSTEREGRDRGRLIAAAAISVSALGWFPTTALVIALPDVQTQFGTSVTELGWVPNAYTLSVAATIIAAGRVSDRLGHRRFFIAGTLGFSAAVALAAISPGFGFLLAAVAIAGVAGAFMFTSSLAILKARFTGRALTLTIALWAAASGLGQALGVPLGGLLEDSALGWRSIFYLAIPFGLFAAWVGIRRVQESRETTTAPLDVAGAVGVGATVVMLVIAGMQGPDWGWLAPSTLGIIAGAALAAVLAARAMRRASEPILPLDAFRDRGFIGGITVNSVANVCLSGVLFLAPLFLEDALGDSPGSAGVSLLALTGTLVIASVAGGRLVGVVSARTLLGGSAVLLVIGLLLAAPIEATTTYRDLVPGWIVAGFGIGLIGSVALNVALANVPRATAGSAGGVFSAAAILGGTFGVTAASALFDAFSGDTDPTGGNATKIAEGASGAMYALAAIAGVVVILALTMLRGSRPSPALEAGASDPT